MPYKSLKDANPALKGIKPKITLAQANLIARWADAMEKAEDGPESAWAAAIAQFKKLYKSEGGKWVKKQQKESAADYKGYTTSTNSVLISINAVDVDGEAVPVAELVAAYEEQRGQGQGVGGERQRDGGADTCICPECGRELEHERGTPCNERECPDCGVALTGKSKAEEMDIDKVRDLLQEALAMLDAPIEFEEVELAESAAGHAVGLEETQAVTGGPRAPLLMNVALIRPGFGNKKDNHYYPREVLERDAKIFEGVKMYATDHRPDEKSVRTEVAVIKTCPVAFTDDGAPIAQVAVHDGGFAEQARNRAELGTLESLECSILGSGRVKKGEVDGQKANIVEAITKASSVDFVTKAGAGGHALNLAENDGGEQMSEEQTNEASQVEETQTEEATLAENQEQEQAQEQQAPQQLAEAKITEMLSETNLPSASKNRLAKGEYEDESALRTAILAEVEYVKTLTGSGQPFAQGGRAQQQEEIKPLSERLDAIDARYGLQVPQGQEV